MEGQPQGLTKGDILAGRYRIASAIGSGGMSRVLLAEDLKLTGKRWAVKEMYAGLEGPRRSALRQAMLLEAETMSRLAHPSLPDIVDVVPVNAGGFLYLVMDFIEGETLEERFSRQGSRMEAGQVVQLAMQLCGLLDYLHSIRPEPVIHRDLKPSNLMIDPSGRVRLIDFGTARRYKPERTADTVNLGTIGFAAPEQFDGRQSDPRTDLYGLGALMYYLLSGGTHYTAQRMPERSLPADLAPLVLKLLRASPAERYADARETEAALRDWLAAQRRQAPPAPGPAPSAGGAGWAPPHVVAVGGLYAGAGATFIALALAQALHERGVAHAVIEPPSPRAELAALLFADQHAPPHYRYYDEDGGGLRAEGPAWERGQTLWLPSSATAADEGASAFADAGAWLKLFHAVRRPVLIVDIGDRWEQPETRSLLETATDVIYVVDPLVHKLQLSASRQRLQFLLDEVRPGRRLYGFANKCLPRAEQAAWLRLLPERPGCLVPAVDFAGVAESGWRGRLPVEHPIVTQAVLAWVERWLPSELKPVRRSASPSLVPRFLRRLLALDP